MELPGKPGCCWEATAPKTSYRSLDRNGEADVAIIGAGIEGLSSIDELPYVMGLVRQSFEKQMGNGAEA